MSHSVFSHEVPMLQDSVNMHVVRFYIK